jgi:uncharacterized integral membrane protein
MKKAKVIAIIIISLLALIVFLQNTKAVETRLLFLTITMPRVLLLILTFVMGFIGGLITASYILRKPSQSDTNTASENR